MRYLLPVMVSVLLACSSPAGDTADGGAPGDDAGPGTVNPPSGYAHDGAAIVVDGPTDAGQPDAPADTGSICVDQCRPFADGGKPGTDPDAGTPEGCTGQGGHCGPSYVPGVMCCFK